MSPDILEIATGSAKSFDNVSFTNETGTVNWLATSGSVSVRNGAQVVNQALWDAQGDDTLLNGTGNVATFTNQGTLRKSGGAGTTTIGTSAAFVFVNSGTIDVQTGTMRFDGASTFNDGSTFTGAGVAEVSASSTFAGALSSQNLRLVSGTQTGNAASITGGTVAFSGGSLTGTWNVAAAGKLVVDTNSSKTIRDTGTVLTNQGTVAWLDGSGSLNVIGGAQIVNQGLWDAQGDDTVYNSTGVASTFTNQGTLRKSGGTGTTAIGTNPAFVFVNSGTIEVQTGTMRFDGASTFNDGTAFTGAGVAEVSASSTFAGPLSSQNLRLVSGTQTGNAASIAGGTVAFRGGELTGTWNVAAAGTLVVDTNSSKTIRDTGTVLTNQGTVAWLAGSGSLNVIGGAQIVNQGLWDAQGDETLYNSTGVASTFTNQGTLRKSGGTGTTTIGTNPAFVFVNEGVADVRTGSIKLPASFGNDGVLMGDGRFVVTGTLTNRGTLAPGSFGAGTLTLQTDLVQAAGSTLKIDLTSLAMHDLLIVTGDAQLNGSLVLRCLGACSYEVGETITILQSDDELSGTFAGSPTLQGFATGAFEVLYDYDGFDRVQLRVTEAVTAVPEPGSYALMLGGLAFVGWLARRRRR